MTEAKPKGLPWSFYAVLVTFAVFFLGLNMYFLTIWLDHPLRSDIWILLSAIGLVGLVYSVRMVRVHQDERIREKELEND